ncbi:hypothetical protein [Streptomyces spinoverrucosus]|uniref:hypothetical protein n=1 Tax=Streptomyces spinoverrucosus TaxID=284043 RepID=UPI003570A288
MDEIKAIRRDEAERAATLGAEVRFLDAGDYQTLLYWLASFGGLLLVYGVATWLPTLMRGESYELGSALTFVVLFNLGGIVGMLLAGRAADSFGAPRISAIWFALTVPCVFLLSVHMPPAVTMTLVFLSEVFLNSAQTMIYAIFIGAAALRGARKAPSGSAAQELAGTH